MVYQAEQDRILFGQIAGLMVSRGALNGQSVVELPDYIDIVGKEVVRAVKADPDNFERKLGAAGKRYVFIT